MSREVNLLGYLPLFVQNYKEIQSIMGVEKEEIENVFNEATVVRENQYIVTADKIGIKRFEKLLGISPLKSDTLETRRARVLALWIRNIPYTYETLDSMLKGICGEGFYEMSLFNEIYKLDVLVKLAIKDRFEDIKKLLDVVVPCNLGVKLYIDYNKHRLFKPFMYKEAEKFTHKELREKIIVVDEYLFKYNGYEWKDFKHSDLKFVKHNDRRRKGEWYCGV
ncbi:MAG: putative phage tail protein [Lachnospirales bacterium]